VRGDATEASDADVLVDFSIKSFDNYMGLKFFLEEQLGVKVDLVITETLKPAIQQNILKEVKYVA
jgi:predicted nucleotidyltransferase